LASVLLVPCLVLLCSRGVVANPVYPDEQSLENGAQLYDLYCSECHGIATVDVNEQQYESDDLYAEDGYSEPIELIPEQETALPLPKPDTFKWPEWAERPDPNADKPLDPRAQTAAELTALINEAHGITPESDSGSGPGPESTSPEDAAAIAATDDDAVFDPLPGATNLADPTAYFYGTSEQEMFDSIANGTGVAMVGWREELGSDEAIWDLINYLRSFWSEEWQY